VPQNRTLDVTKPHVDDREFARRIEFRDELERRETIVIALGMQHAISLSKSPKRHPKLWVQ